MRGWAIAAVAIASLWCLPVAAEPRWLGCKFSMGGREATFQMVFDDQRNTAYLLDAGFLVEGTGTTINYQALRTRFPAFMITYNRNNGALSVTPPTGGIWSGECQRIAQPAGAPNPQ